MPPASGVNGNVHVTRLRPFRPRERGPAYAPEKPAAPWLQAANQSRAAEAEAEAEAGGSGPKSEPTAPPRAAADAEQPAPRSEERRVGKEGRTRRARESGTEKKKHTR